MLKTCNVNLDLVVMSLSVLSVIINGNSFGSLAAALFACIKPDIYCSGVVVP